MLLGGEQVYVAVRLLVVARAAYFAPIVGKRRLHCWQLPEDPLRPSWSAVAAWQWPGG